MMSLRSMARAATLPRASRNGELSNRAIHRAKCSNERVFVLGSSESNSILATLTLDYGALHLGH
jgi:hypothetical protein